MYYKVLEAIICRDFDILFMVSRELDGMYGWDGRVYISIYASRPVAVLIHEVLHILYPKKSEEWVLKHEDRLYAQLTPQDKKYLYGVIYRARRKYEKARLAHAPRGV